MPLPATINPHGYVAPTHARILDIRPADMLAYWPLWETSSATSRDLRQTNLAASRDGAYNGTALGLAQGVDGNYAALNDGVNDGVNVYTESLRDAFNGAAGTIIGSLYYLGDWAAVAPVEQGWNFQADADNRIAVLKPAANTIQVAYVAGGVAKQVSVSAFAPSGWFQVALTWDADADEACVFVDGTQVGQALTGLGVWAGTLAADRCVLGATSTDGAGSWHGRIQHVALWRVALSAAEIREASV